MCLRENPWELQPLEVPYGQSHTSPLELTSCHRLPRMLQMELPGLVFALVNFGFPLVLFPCIPVFVPFGIVMFT